MDNTSTASPAERTLTFPWEPNKSVRVVVVRPVDHEIVKVRRARKSLRFTNREFLVRADWLS